MSSGMVEIKPSTALPGNGSSFSRRNDPNVPAELNLRIVCHLVCPP